MLRVEDRGRGRKLWHGRALHQYIASRKDRELECVAGVGVDAKLKKRIEGQVLVHAPLKRARGAAVSDGRALCQNTRHYSTSQM